jgi:hypothetical protein
MERVIDVFMNGVKYYDPKYDTLIRFKDGVAISLDKETLQVISVQTQKIATERWILK